MCCRLGCMDAKLTNRLQEPCVHPSRPETPLRTSTAAVHRKSAKRGFSPKPHLEETNQGVCQLRKRAVHSVNETASPAPPLRTYAATIAALLIAAKPRSGGLKRGDFGGFAAIKPDTPPRSTCSKLTNRLEGSQIYSPKPETPPR